MMTADDIHIQQGASDEDISPLVIRAICNIEAAIRSNYGEKLHIGEAWGSVTAQAGLSTGALDTYT